MAKKGCNPLFDKSFDKKETAQQKVNLFLEQHSKKLGVALKLFKNRKGVQLIEISKKLLGDKKVAKNWVETDSTKVRIFQEFSCSVDYGTIFM